MDSRIIRILYFLYENRLKPLCGMLPNANAMRLTLFFCFQCIPRSRHIPHWDISLQIQHAWGRRKTRTHSCGMLLIPKKFQFFFIIYNLHSKYVCRHPALTLIEETIETVATVLKNWVRNILTMLKPSSTKHEQKAEISLGLSLKVFRVVGVKLFFHLDIWEMFTSILQPVFILIKN